MADQDLIDELLDKFNKNLEACDECYIGSAGLGSQKVIVFCPVHAAAPELLEAAQAIYRVAKDAMLPGPVHLSGSEVRALGAAITKAEKED